MTKRSKVIKLEAIRYCLAGLVGARLSPETAYEVAEMLRTARLKLLRKARITHDEPDSVGC